MISTTEFYLYILYALNSYNQVLICAISIYKVVFSSIRFLVLETQQEKFRTLTTDSFTGINIPLYVFGFILCVFHFFCFVVLLCWLEGLC